MKLCGEKVRHITFGYGEIVDFYNNYVIVLFANTGIEKKFVYPTAFGTFLELKNKSLLKQIEKDKQVIHRKEEAERIRVNEKRIQQAEIIKMKKTNVGRKNKTNTKAPENSNIAFKCNYCDGGKYNESVGYRGVCSDQTIQYNIKEAKHIWCSQPENMCYKYLNREISRKQIDNFYEESKTEFGKSVCYECQMLELWSTGAGIIHSGVNKGKPKKLKNVKENSLALLTTKLPCTEEKSRFIFAVFLVDESYEGDNIKAGFVGADPKYRIELSLNEAKELKFWDHYFNPNKPEKIIFGSGLHRYITDIQAAQVLKRIIEIKKGTTEETLSLELLEHYCKIKKLDIDNIPMQNGALHRS